MHDQDHLVSIGIYEIQIRSILEKKFVTWIRCAIYVKFHENIRQEILSVPMWDSKRGGGLTDDVPCADINYVRLLEVW